MMANASKDDIISIKQLALGEIEKLRINFNENSLNKLREYIGTLFISGAIGNDDFNGLVNNHFILIKWLLKYNKECVKSKSTTLLKEHFKFKPLWMKDLISLLSYDVSISYASVTYYKVRTYAIKLFGMEFKFSYELDIADEITAIENKKVEFELNHMWRIIDAIK